MNSKIKKIISIVLVCATVCSIFCAMTFNSSAAVVNPNKKLSIFSTESVNVNGTIDEGEWDNAAVNTLEVDAFQDSKGNADTRKQSSTVKFRIMNDGKTIYMLFEIYDKGGDWRFGNGTNWKNDSLFICVSENPNPVIVNNSGINDSKIGDANYGESVYCLCAYPDTDSSKKASDIFFARSGKGDKVGGVAVDRGTDIKVTEVDNENRIIELSFELQTLEGVYGDHLFLDVMYNDADDYNNKEEGSNINSDNPRTIVWNWSTNFSNGMSAGNAGATWGRIDFLGRDTVDAKAAAIKVDSITVDGTKDAKWDMAPKYEMDAEVWGDSRGDVLGKLESSHVSFRIMYSETKVYMLFEIYDDTWISGQTTHWQNDSIMIFISEDGVDRKISSTASYCLAAYPTTGDDDSKLFFARKANCNDKAKEHGVVVDGQNATMEISFELNDFGLEAGNSFNLDLQYNDQDKVPASTGEQSRTVVWGWSAYAWYGPNQNPSLWGSINLVDSLSLEHHANKENGASFYYQENADKSSYRIIGLIDEVSVANINGIKIAFSDGTTEKSVTLTEATAYTSIDATFDGVTVTYVADEGAVIVGWIVTGVAEGFVPSAVTVLNS